MATATATFPRPLRGTRNASQRVGGRAPSAEDYQIDRRRRALPPELIFLKRIDNSRLFREVNPERRRQCFSLLGLSVVAFMFFLLFAWQHFQCVRYGYQIETLKTQRAGLEEWNRQLRLDRAALSDPQRIDTLARQEGLVPPGPRQVIQVGAEEETLSEGASELARNALVPGPPGAPALSPEKAFGETSRGQ